MRALRKLADKPVIGPIVKSAMRYFADKKVDSISSHFSQFLKPVFAYTDNLKAETFKVRHNVYCEELHFLELSESGLERDAFDNHSLHCAIQHKHTNQFAGTVRLVYSSDKNEKLPIEAYCIDSIKNEEIHPSDFSRDKICEISRLAIPAQFRRRNADKFKGAATGAINEQAYSEDELRCFPFIAVGLYMSCASMAHHNGIKHCFVMMEPRLARSLRFVGIPFKQIGPIVEYHGKRAPYYISNKMLMDSLSPGFRKLMFKIEDDLEGQFLAAKQQGYINHNKPKNILTAHKNAFVSTNGKKLFQL
ncbi:PEP-CTERM/exosortase system-associated acyltransferase [Catenovulum sediminis]|uniref:PEP-CTERM/exosortase system-associated acyltransferase n=1 Tax=Catenovulum sediminis TaxID=1740262 RepID=UPI00117D50BF|nr:PEP-CTERM/exosortase system-associated acyltransferase [Catenovulum sediminis]